MPSPLTPEVITIASPHPCPYLPGETARLPLRLPLAPISRQELDVRLAAGARRCGSSFYFAECPTCRACVPLRLPVNRFAPNASQRRALRQGDQIFTLALGKPQVDNERLNLFNAHSLARGLARHETKIVASEYRVSFVETTCETFEMQYRVENRLAALAVVDRGATSLSAVYTFFDPRLSHFSPGTYSILKQVELARTWGLEYVYLGFYIAACSHMAYKARFRPHERRVAGEWIAFDGRPA